MFFTEAIFTVYYGAWIVVHGKLFSPFFILNHDSSTDRVILLGLAAKGQKGGFIKTERVRMQRDR
jgi:hypothetical protein